MKLLKQLIFLSLFVPFMAWGADDTIEVSATGASQCTINAGSLVFGAYTGEPVGPITATVSLSCTGTLASLNLSINDGGFYSGGRRMEDGSGHFLPYRIALDSAGNTPWSNPKTISLTPDSGNSIGSTNVYGFIDASQNFIDGTNYTDNLTVTVAF